MISLLKQFLEVCSPYFVQSWILVFQLGIIRIKGDLTLNCIQVHVCACMHYVLVCAEC